MQGLTLKGWSSLPYGKRATFGPSASSSGLFLENKNLLLLPSVRYEMESKFWCLCCTPRSFVISSPSGATCNILAFFE